MKDKVAALTKFFRETRSEVKKVTWPPQRYVTVATSIVLLIVVASGLYVTLVDFILARVFKLLIK